MRYEASSQLSLRILNSLVMVRMVISEVIDWKRSHMDVLAGATSKLGGNYKVIQIAMLDA